MGHSVLYLNGVCRDRALRGYPVIGLCDPGQGVGHQFQRAFQQRRLGCGGWAEHAVRAGRCQWPDAGPVLSALRLEAQQSGIYDGVIFHDAAFSDIVPGYSNEDWKYEVSIGTDYAIGIARSPATAPAPR